MKKIPWLLICFILIVTITIAQNKTKKETEQPYIPKVTTGAEIEFDKIVYDYGILAIGDVKTGIFTYKNVGNKPLVLFDVAVSCDCTEVEWQKEPLMPGKTGTIKAVYTAKTAGIIAKQITVQSNACTDRIKLQLKGRVQE